jgi:farnesyl-diphosphate farnesyltransferase
MTGGRETDEPLPFCHEILGEVSRTFALTIPQLPRGLRDEVCVAYLICRVADTIEDHETLDTTTRSRLFTLLTQLLRNPVDREAWSSFRALWPGVKHAGYDRLVAHLPLLLRSFGDLPRRTRGSIRACVDEMVDGMARYAGCGTRAVPRRVCNDLDQLENYCHYVAATVGGLLTRLFHPVFTGVSTPPSRELLERGRRFGLALQMTNVLKDYRDDLAQGRAYLPPDALEERDGEWRLVPGGMRPLLDRLLSHMDEAERYILWIPAAQRGTRLFCVWALHLALRTLVRVASLDVALAVKVPRRELAEIVARAEAAVNDDAELDRLYQSYRTELAAMIGRLTPPPAAPIESLPQAG